MKRLILLVGLIFILLLQSTYASSSLGLDSTKILSPEQLKTHLNEKNIIIVDVSLDPNDYVNEHIPNSVYVDWLLELADQRDKKYYRAVPKEGFEEVMSRIGATQDKTLIFYDNMQNRFAIRALFVTEFYGHTNTAILEGGIQAWKAAGFKTSQEKTATTPSQYTVKRINSMMMVDKEFVKTNLHNKDITFVDGRPRGMYTGEKPGIMIHTRKEVARRGHLPGAINIPWKSHIDKDSKFLDKNTLKKMYTENGVVKDKTIVVYCNEGLHAVYNWFVLTKMLGFTNVRGYGGSMGEWADDPLLPMVSGIEF